MLAKSMSYWANGEAVKESAIAQDNRGGFHKLQSLVPREGAKNDGFGERFQPSGSRNPRSVLHEARTPAAEFTALRQWLTQYCPDVLDAYQADQREPRDVVTPSMSTHGLEHHASYPPALIEPLIKATCPERVCPQCGQGWAPVVESTPCTMPPTEYEGVHRKGIARGKAQRMNAHLRARRMEGHPHNNPFPSALVHGLTPTCAHYCTCDAAAGSPEGYEAAPATCGQCTKLLLSQWSPGIVLDPFAGTGTTAEVARALGRTSIMVEASWQYVHALARQRLGLADLAAWAGQAGPAVVPQDAFDDLPLFGLIP
jgi:DNA methylase